MAILMTSCMHTSGDAFTTTCLIELLSEIQRSMLQSLQSHPSADSNSPPSSTPSTPSPYAAASAHPPVHGYGGASATTSFSVARPRGGLMTSSVRSVGGLMTSSVRSVGGLMTSSVRSVDGGLMTSSVRSVDQNRSAHHRRAAGKGSNNGLGNGAAAAGAAYDEDEELWTDNAPLGASAATAASRSQRKHSNSNGGDSDRSTYSSSSTYGGVVYDERPRSEAVLEAALDLLEINRYGHAHSSSSFLLLPPPPPPLSLPAFGVHRVCVRVCVFAFRLMVQRTLTPP